jgi:Flp pilus assembly protein TadD
MHALSTACLAVALLWTAPAGAVDSDTPSKKSAGAGPLATARGLIAARQWPAAIDELRRVDAKADADWNNLMGYSLRKADPPDLAAAERHYDAALRIDPKHRGALEYSGELYLIQGRLADAEQRLATLNNACTFGCEEYTDLKRSVQRYRANGGRATVAP